jgi:hypothetical protein
VNAEPEKLNCAPVRKVLDFPPCTSAQSPKKAKLRTGAQSKPKAQKQKTSAKVRTGAQTDESETLKSLLPSPPSGWWWVVDADASGFKIKLRWREGAPPHSVVFPRLGKKEFKTLMEVSSEDRQWLITDRIHADLIAKDRRDIARRLGFESGDHRQSLAAG